MQADVLLDTNSEDSPAANKTDVDWRIVLPAFLFPALGGALFGYDIGASSGALLSLKDQVTSGTDW